MIIPIYKDKKFVKLHNIFGNIDELEEEFKEEIINLKESLMELIAETDDDILDKYFSGEELDEDDIQKGLTLGIERGDIIPVICGSSINNLGTIEILDTITTYLQPKHLDIENKFKGFIFKTIVDPFVGKISYLKITQGKIEKDTEIFNIDKYSKEKISNLYTMKNKELVEIDKANCGDIVILTKFSNLQTGDTLSLNKDDESILPITFPKPQIYFSITPKN